MNYGRMNMLVSVASLATLSLATYSIEDEYRKKAELKEHPFSPRKGRRNSALKGSHGRKKYQALGGR